MSIVAAYHGEEGAEPQSKALNLLAYINIQTFTYGYELWVMTKTHCGCYKGAYPQRSGWGVQGTAALLCQKESDTAYFRPVVPFIETSAFVLSLRSLCAVCVFSVSCLSYLVEIPQVSSLPLLIPQSFSCCLRVFRGRCCLQRLAKGHWTNGQAWESSGLSCTHTHTHESNTHTHTLQSRMRTAVCYSSLVCCQTHFGFIKVMN